MALLRAVHAALPPDGTLLITEPMAQTPGAERAGDAYFGFYLLAMGSGRPRSADEIKAMLQAAGFTRTRTVATSVPLTTRIIVAAR
jgi:demethylspheroidene O-methyltransferase